MQIALFGPICRDEIVINGKSHHNLGSVLYYAGNALYSLGAIVTLVATYGRESKSFLKELRYDKLHYIRSEGTIKFINEYPTGNMDLRIQKALIKRNCIYKKDIKAEHIDNKNAIVLGPLFHDNISLKVIKQMQSPTFLAAQGLIRYLNGDRIIWKRPENVLSALPYVDYVFLDEKEAFFVTQKETVYEQASVLKNNGAKNIIITRGQKGSMIFTSKKSFEIPAVAPKRITDPTGCGDTYLAGFVFATSLFKNKDFQKIGEFAAMAAAAKIENRGPMMLSCSRLLKRLSDRKKI